SRTLEKRLYQEAGSKCVFCPEAEVASLQIHHIDEDRANNNFDNLILVCANCHTKITRRVWSEADVRIKKRQVATLDKNLSGAWGSEDIKSAMFSFQDSGEPDPIDKSSFDLDTTGTNDP
ncbi:MAG: HNH endonuclease signature motif containing protein, partial [Fimbriimonadaceae bacterium]